jgi:hypothetical protein
MADPAHIEEELKQFLDIEEKIRKVDRLPYLMAIVNKHFGLDKIDHIATHRDLEEVISVAKAEWPHTVAPMNISGKEVTGPAINYVLVLEAFVGYLNRNKLLKRLVKFDHTRRR